MMDLVDLWNMFAVEVSGMRAGWRWVEWNTAPEICPEGFVKLVGAVYPKGKWKKRDKATEKTIFIKIADVNAFQIRKADAAGVCRKCWGTGKLWHGWGEKTGTRWKQCPECKGWDGTPDPKPIEIEELFAPAGKP